MLTDRKLGPFEIKLIQQLDQRYFYVLNNPTAVGPRPKGVDPEHVEEGIAEFLRAMRRNKSAPSPGMIELPKAKPISALTFKDNK